MDNNTIQIWHNQRCSKSRDVKTIVEESEFDFHVVEYLKEELTKNDILHIMTLLGIKDIRDMLRSKEDEYKEYNLDNPSLTQNEIIDIVLKNPKLIERPIVIKGDKAIIARPPELLKEFL